MRYEDAWNFHDEALSFLQRAQPRSRGGELTASEDSTLEDVRIAVAVEGDENEARITLRVRELDSPTQRAIEDMWASGVIPEDCPITVVGPLIGFGGPGDLIQPLQAGVACAHRSGLQGTLGAILRSGENLLLLSANHVLARENRAHENDFIVQPTSVAAAKRNIGRLMEYEELKGTGNLMDAAVARILVDDVVNLQFNGKRIEKTRGELLRQGDLLFKFGQSSLERSGSFRSIASNVQLQMEIGLYAFDFHIEVESVGEPFSSKGDSGALVYDAQDQAVGIVIGGSEFAIDGSFRTYVSPIAPILKRYNAELARA